MLNTANIFILDLTSYFWIEEKQFIAFEETMLEVTFHRGGYLGRTDVIEVTYDDARAIDPNDYAPIGDATITFNDDETTATKMIVIEPDNILEYNEMFFLEIEIPAGSTLLDTARLDSPSVSEVIIKDPTWYVFDCADFTVIESTGQVVITIIRKGDLRTEGHVWIATRDRVTPAELTASSTSSDFTPVNMQVGFAADIFMETVTIDITHDLLVEGDEQFQVYLYDPDTAEALGDLHKAIVTIYDDDDSSTFAFKKVVYHVTESGGSVTITILRDGPLVTDTAGSVDISTVDSHDNRLLTAEDGTDFVGFESKTLDFPAGNRIEHYTINLVDGVDVDKQEYFEVCMSNLYVWNHRSTRVRHCLY
ncbi:FRAS1-related extracellular matrix protein 3-like [Amphiura filiformis]|uniref:FRAS1-related extracellular matrix protein 3-like n=1 Tax=Amphiura filiformis TaxID=82378 RepID=UPI003B21844A